MAGLFALLAGRWRGLRFLGWSALVLFTLQIASQSSRPDRIAAVYPFLLAAGAVATEEYIRNHFARGALVTVAAASAAALLPIVTPLLPPPALAIYMTQLGLQDRIAIERGKTSPIPQLLADRTGWESFVDDIDRVYHNLPDDDRSRSRACTGLRPCCSARALGTGTWTSPCDFPPTTATTCGARGTRTPTCSSRWVRTRGT